MSLVKLEKNKIIATITINKPEAMNALSSAVLLELDKALEVVENEMGLRCLIITGEGDKAFVAGADIKEIHSLDPVQAYEFAGAGQRVFMRMENLNIPVIAAVNGFALGGGLELAMAAHIRIASDNARLGLPEVSLGVIPGYGGTQRLAQLVGRGKAMEMITTAGMISAEEAQSWGLVNHVVPQAELMDLANKIANKILNNSPNAIAAAIKSINANYVDGVDGMQIEIDQFGRCFGTPEFIEGTTAFLEKRKAEFRK